jgi:Ca2+-binding RTX toxin-like protein
MTLAIWGTENLVQPTGVDYTNVVAALPDGGYVVGFVANGSVYFQRYDGAGNKLGGPALVAGSANLTIMELDVHATGPDGNFVITWAESAKTGTAISSVKAQIFNSGGQPVTGSPITLGSFSSSARSDAPSIIGTSSGGFVAVYNDPTGAQGVKMSIYNNGAVETLQISGGRYADVTMIGPDKYVVSYQLSGVVTQRIVDFSSADPLGDEISVGAGKVSDVAKIGNGGGYLVFYSAENGSSGAEEVRAKLYSSSGGAVGNPITITDNGQRTQNVLEVTTLKDGRVAVIYSEQVGTGFNPEDDGNIYLRVIDGNLNLGPALLLNSDAPTDGDAAQVKPSITELADGRVAVSWHDRYGPARALTNIVDVRIAAVTVNGTAGNDVYAGSEYNGNQLNGLDGNDKLIGGAGSDFMDGGDGIDSASYERSAAGVIVSLAGGPGAGGDAAGDTYANIENVMGSQHSDTITGNDAANYLWGLGGNDALIGGGGQDTLEGGAGNDSYYVDASDVIVEAAGGGIDTVYTSGSINLAAMANIENIVFTGTGPVNITGSAGDNTLNGGAGGDGIDGGAGNDLLNGGDGNDSLYGGAGNDILVGGNGFDYLTGDIGNDTLDGGADNDFLDGGAGFDSLVGGTGNDTLNGGADNDVLDGGAGSDNLIGGEGFDVVRGGDGNDTLVGGNGNDTLDGGAGDDQIWGGLGKDVLTGSAGRDIFVFDYKPSKSHADRITDFNYRQDSIYIENSYFKKFGSGSVTKPGKLKSQFFKVGTKATDANDYIVYNKKTGVLYWDKDGSGGSKAVEIAYLKKGATVTASDFLII